jgi:hypothetical protein
MGPAMNSKTGYDFSTMLSSYTRKRKHGLAYSTRIFENTVAILFQVSLA